MKSNNTNTLESILKEFSAQKQLVDNLGDALMNIAMTGQFNERGEWEEPKWKPTVLFDLAQARGLIQKLYLMSLEVDDQQTN